jgi:hypothetical protein
MSEKKHKITVRRSKDPHYEEWYALIWDVSENPKKLFDVTQYRETKQEAKEEARELIKQKLTP